MDGSPVVVVLLLVIKHFSASPWPCSISKEELQSNDVRSVATSPFGRYVTGQHLYLHYEDNFDGVELKITETSGKISMWFDLDRGCFAHPTYWWKMHISCGYLPDAQYVWCVMVGGDCRWHCNKKYSTEDQINFSVVAHGHSAWRLEPPDLNKCGANVTWLYRNSYPSDNRACRGLKGAQPQRPSTPAADHRMLIVVSVVVVVVVLMAVAIVILIMKLKQSHRHRPAAPIIAMDASQTHPPRQTPEVAPDTLQNDGLYDDVEGTPVYDYCYVLPSARP